MKTWNKGMKGLQIGGEETQFKKGHRPHNWKPIGSERINKYGYVEVKYKDERNAVSNYMQKHRLVWMQANGPVPDGYVVVFKDGNRMNFDLDNLELISNKKNLERNFFSSRAIAKRLFGVADEDLEEFIKKNKDLINVKKIEYELNTRINDYERARKRV